MALLHVAAFVGCCLLGSFSRALPTSVRPVPSESYPFQYNFDNHNVDKKGNGVVVYWKFNASHITFEIHASTHGYIGFGLSNDGQFFPADIVVGWIKDGVTHFQDSHTEKTPHPVRDSSQDWTLLHAEENAFGTILKLVRKLDTCDRQDVVVEEGSNYLLYFYDELDPADENSIVINDKTKMASRGINLLNQVKESPMPSDVITKDVLNQHWTLPNTKVDTHMCRVFDFKDLGRKHHLIKMEPVIQEGHYYLIHHIFIHKCPGIDRKFIGHYYDCDAPDDPSLWPCPVVHMAYAPGGDGFHFPDDVGYPVGEADDDELYIIFMHYYNPYLESGFVDSSGVRFYLTPTLRKHDVGILQTGVSPDDYHIVPPRYNEFTSTGFCTDNCLQRGLKDHPQGVKVVGVYHHAHLWTKRTATRIIRNGVELEPLMDDRHFKFQYQSLKYLHRNATIMPGDTLLTECTYDTKNMRVPLYGIVDQNAGEMCLSFIVYYPRMDVERCVTTTLYDNVLLPREQIIPSFSKYDWRDANVRQHFKDLVATSKHTATCYGKNMHPQTHNETVQIPHPTTPYRSKSVCGSTDAVIDPPIFSIG